MELNVKKNRDEFITHLAQVKRNGVKDLIDWLDSTDFFTAPCSTRFHLCCEGGLAQHSLNVMRSLFYYNSHLGDLVYRKYYDLTNKKYEKETIILCGLLHDICKVNTYKSEIKWRKNDSNEWENYNVYVFDEDYPYGHGEKSVYLIQKFVQLTDEEAQAINAHMGFSDQRDIRLIGNIFDNNDLAVLLHFADMTATYFMEPKI